MCRRADRSKASRPSIRAQSSAARVREARMAASALLLPEPTAPKISVSAPRGKPCASASRAAMPVEAVSANCCPRYWNGAETRPARADSTSNRNAAADFRLIATIQRRPQPHGQGRCGFLSAGSCWRLQRVEEKKGSVLRFYFATADFHPGQIVASRLIFCADFS